MKVSEERIYREALESATGQAMLVPPEELSLMVFPFWQKAVHEILILTSCQCICHDHNEAKCFLSLNPTSQIKLYSGGELSFEGFLETLDSIKQLFLLESMVSSTANI
ncbi:MAG: hypothetical protein Q8Q90_00980 [bacterium]|nr:hypothetical protein [bacterium]